MNPVIRFIVVTSSSKGDAFGNRSHCAIITSTKTGREIGIRDMGGPGNAASLVRSAINAFYPTIWNYEIDDIPRRQWQEIQRCRLRVYEYEVTPEMIRALEEPGL